MRVSRIGLSSALAVFWLLACGSTVDSEGVGGVSYTLDNICDTVAPGLCTDRESCCADQGYSYDEAGCVARERETCEEDVARARAGDVSFHPELVDDCLVSAKAVFGSCVVAISDLVDVRNDLVVCTKVFRGDKAEGAACTDESECALPDGGFADCEDDKCVHSLVVGEGGSCSFDGGNLCEDGLYCDNPDGGMCKVSLAAGATCDPMKDFLSCGLGSYCEGMTQKCTTSKASGEACDSPLQCVSLSCGASLCVGDGFSFVDESECGGVPSGG